MDVPLTDGDLPRVGGGVGGNPVAEAHNVAYKVLGHTGNAI